MILDSQRLIQRFLARLQTRWNALNQAVERALVEKSTAVPILTAQGADNSMHCRSVAVVRPAL